MKQFITFILTIIIAIAVYGGAIINSSIFDANCIDYFELAANANSVELAEKYLSNGIEYLEKEGLTQGKLILFLNILQMILISGMKI